MAVPITFFVSYPRRDARLAQCFMEHFQEQTAPSRRYDYSTWLDTAIPLGAPWHDTIQQALDSSNGGLLLLTPAFLHSTYITEHELPRLMERPAQPVVPVLLKPLNLQLHDLHGLERYQIFSLGGQQSFFECRTPVLRSRFAATLFARIEERLDTLGLHD